MDQVIRAIEVELSKASISKYKRNRLLAIKYYLDGLSTVMISDMVGISTRSVQRYLKEYTEKGIDNLFTKRTPGNSSKLTTHQQLELENDLNQSTRHFGFTVAKWSSTLLSIHLEEKFGVHMSNEACRLLLKDIENIEIPTVKTNSIASKKIKQGFDIEINQLLQRPNTEVWLFGQFYIGFRAVYKTKTKNKKRRAIVFCAIQYGGDKQVCQFFNPFQDKKEQWMDLLNEAFTHTDRNNVHFFIPKSPINRYIADHFINPTEKLHNIEFFPTGLQPELYLDQLKNKIVSTMKLSCNWQVLLYEKRQLILYVFWQKDRFPVFKPKAIA